MTQLKTQPSAMPTRKLLAVMLVTFLVQGALGVADYFAPGIRSAIPAADIVAMIVPFVAGWFVKDKA